MSKAIPVRVRFSMDRETWDKVVTFEENYDVEVETQTHFVIAYANEREFNAALRRFDGMVEYQKLEAETTSAAD